MTKRVLITGANKGIGLATAEAVLTADSDAFVYLGSRDRERGDAARASLDGLAERVEVVEIDVASDDSVRAARAAVGATPLYGIINNAGMMDGNMERVLNVNTRGPRRVCSAFIPLLEDAGRVVNVSSAAGPMFVAKCSPQRRRQLTNGDVTWDDIEAVMAECLSIASTDGSFADAGFGGGAAYGLSKACLNAYTIALARTNPNFMINACTPGFIATDLTKGFLAGRTADEAGMKSPEDGAKASLHLLLGEPGGSGWYFGSDAQRSPLDRYRSPGDPPYAGD